MIRISMKQMKSRWKYCVWTQQSTQSAGVQLYNPKQYVYMRISYARTPATHKLILIFLLKFFYEINNE